MWLLSKFYDTVNIDCQIVHLIQLGSQTNIVSHGTLTLATQSNVRSLPVTLQKKDMLMALIPVHLASEQSLWLCKYSVSGLVNMCEIMGY